MLYTSAIFMLSRADTAVKCGQTEALVEAGAATFILVSISSVDVGFPSCGTC